MDMQLSNLPYRTGQKLTRLIQKDSNCQKMGALILVCNALDDNVLGYEVLRLSHGPQGLSYHCQAVERHPG